MIDMPTRIKSNVAREKLPAANGLEISYPCLGCDNSKLLRIRKYRTKTLHGKKIFSSSWLCECKVCGLVQAAPRPNLEELADYYSVDYRNGICAGTDVADPTTFPKDNLFYYNRGQSVAELTSPFINTESPNALDIGAGFGHVLHAIGERFPSAMRFATEFSEQCIRHLRSTGIQVFEGDIEDALAQREQALDVVTMSHVFEHLLEIQSILDQIYNRLSSGGILYIEVPNIPSWALLRYPDHVWAPRFDEPHISFFSTSTLHSILRRAGFDVKYCDTAGPEYKFISGWQYSLPAMRWFIQWLMPAGLFSFLRRQSFMDRFKVPERVDAFYQYGGPRIWIRTISVKS